MLHKWYYDFNTPRQKNISVYYISQNTNIVNYFLMKILLLKNTFIIVAPISTTNSKASN